LRDVLTEAFAKKGLFKFSFWVSTNWSVLCLHPIKGLVIFYRVVLEKITKFVFLNFY